MASHYIYGADGWTLKKDDAAEMLWYRRMLRIS